MTIAGSCVVHQLQDHGLKLCNDFATTVFLEDHPLTQGPFQYSCEVEGSFGPSFGIARLTPLELRMLGGLTKPYIISTVVAVFRHWRSVMRSTVRMLVSKKKADAFAPAL